MKKLESYVNTIHELNLFKNRLSMISNLEKQIKVERKSIIDIVEVYQMLINQMECDIQELQGVENKLYYEIVIKGESITKAIDKVANSEFLDVSTLWKYYYPKVKSKIEKLHLLISKKDIN